MDCKETLEIFNERISGIKREHEEGVKRRFEEDELLSMCEDLISIIYTLEKKSKQDNATIKQLLNSQYGKEVTDNINKVQLSSLYGQYHQIYKNVKKVIIDTQNSYFKDKNVDVKITDKFVIIRREENLVFYNINEINYFSIKQNESEVE